MCRVAHVTQRATARTLLQDAIPPKRGGIDYDLYSLGADGKEGGEENNADLGNWQ